MFSPFSFRRRGLGGGRDTFPSSQVRSPWESLQKLFTLGPFEDAAGQRAKDCCDSRFRPPLGNLAPSENCLPASTVCARGKRGGGGRVASQWGLATPTVIVWFEHGTDHPGFTGEVTWNLDWSASFAQHHFQKVPPPSLIAWLFKISLKLKRHFNRLFYLLKILKTINKYFCSPLPYERRLPTTNGTSSTSRCFIFSRLISLLRFLFLPFAGFVCKRFTGDLGHPTNSLRWNQCLQGAAVQPDGVPHTGRTRGGGDEDRGGLPPHGRVVAHRPFIHTHPSRELLSPGSL